MKVKDVVILNEVADDFNDAEPGTFVEPGTLVQRQLIKQGAYSVFHTRNIIAEI